MFLPNINFNNLLPNVTFDPEAPDNIEKFAEDFFSRAAKYGKDVFDTGAQLAFLLKFHLFQLSNPMDFQGFLNLLSFTATSSTIGLFLCGIPICNRIRKRGNTDGTGVAPFWMCSVSCVFWLAYGYMRNDNTVIFVNVVGLIIQTLYLGYYYTKTRLKSWLNKLLLLEFVCCCFTLWLLNSTINYESRENFLGIVCMFLNIATIGAPLADIKQIIITKSTESLPFLLCLGNMFVSVQWLLYGYMVDDFYMKMPNIVAVFISAVQLSLFVIYPSYKTISVIKGGENLL